MLSVDEALALILEHARPRPAAEFARSDSLGLVLAESITSDVDVPPRDQSVVDGYAVVAADLASGSAELEVIEEVTAGRWPTHAVTSGRTTRLMTGVAIPDGADAVVMFERSELIRGAGGPAKARLQDRPIPGQNISRQGASIRRGATVLAPGAEIRAIEIGILAEVGRRTVSAIGRPTVAVLATGDELVDSSETPRPGQIRNSNGPMLLACAQRAGAIVIDAGIGRDTRDHLRQAIERALTADIVVLSGGVSMGVADLAPAVLTELGVNQVFHKVNLKPGKPLWFGMHRAAKAPSAKVGDKLSNASDEEGTRTIAKEHGLPYVDLNEVHISPSVIGLMPGAVARENVVLPISDDGNALKVIVSDPLDLDTFERLRFVLNRKIEISLAPRESILDAIDKHYGRAGSVERLVFGLPGNPVSSLVCFELFVRPAIGRLAGRMSAGLTRISARLAKSHEHRGDRPTYHPARLTQTASGATVEPLPWRGSGDLASLAGANALALFPADDRTYAAGDTVEALLFDTPR